MKTTLLHLLLLYLFTACSQDLGSPNRAGFVTMLGDDTLAVERFEKTEDGMEAKVIVRSPETSFSSYELELDRWGGIRQMIKREHAPDEGFADSGEAVQTIRKEKDSLFVEIQADGEIEEYAVEYREGVLPFIDMVHWPYEVALNNAAKTSQDSIEQQLLSGGRLLTFVIAKMDDDSATIRHPFRGVMGADINENGDLMHLDAGLTTRKLKVHRSFDVDLESTGRRFVEMEQDEEPFGALSGAESKEFSFHDAEFRVEYGTPEKRGRTIFGGIVSWGERWRTGANRATHFRTSHDLLVGDLEVPAGEYTLFTIPEKDGGTLIINRQTGQNGRTYDESRDLGRVPMEKSSRPGVTEKFTIEMEEQGGNGGVLKLIWDRTEFSVDFEIRS